MHTNTIFARAFPRFAQAAALVCVAGLASTVALAAPQAEPGAVIGTVAPPAAAVVPNGAPIVIEITDLVSTRTAQRDDMFSLKLAEPVLLNGKVVIPAGTPGKGVVVDSGKPGMGGKPGKLVLAVRYLELDGRKISIRGLNMDMGAKDNSGRAVTAAVIGGAVGGVIGLAVTGGHMEVQPGTRARAKLGADFVPVAAPVPAEVQPAEMHVDGATPAVADTVAPAASPQS